MPLDRAACQDLGFPRICRLLYARLACLHYIRLVSGDALASTACAVPVWNAVFQHRVLFVYQRFQWAKPSMAWEFNLPRI